MDSAGENLLSCFWRKCLRLVLCFTLHCYRWNVFMRPCFLSDTVEQSLLQGRCLDLVLSCHPGVRQRRVFSDCTTRHQIRLGFAHNSCPFHRHCLLCGNCSECKKKSSSILIWCSVIRKETHSHVTDCHCSQHSCFFSLFFLYFLYCKCKRFSCRGQV